MFYVNRLRIRGKVTDCVQFAILLQYHSYVHITKAYIYLLYSLYLLCNVENYTMKYIIMLYILLVSFSVSSEFYLEHFFMEELIEFSQV